MNTIKRAVNIDTRFRPNYYTTKSSDLQINLPTKVERAISMRLASIEIPMSFYAVSSAFGNNVFKVTWGVADASSAIITLTEGNYDVGDSDKTKAARIETEINTKLLASEAGVATVGKLNLRYEVNPINGKSRFFQDPSGTLVPAAIPFKIHFMVDKNGVDISANESFQTTLGWMLGYRSSSGGVYTSNGKVITGGGGSGGGGTDGSGNIISEGICNVQGIRYIYVSIDDYVNSSNNYFTAAFANSVMAPNIITRINVADLAQDVTVYHYAQQEGYSTELDRSRSYFGPVDIQKMRVTLYDEYGRVVNLNYMDWSMELMFECVYS